jgi:hypothetical protein
MVDQTASSYISPRTILQRSFPFLAGGAILAFVRLAVPAFFDTGHTVDDLLHSNVIWWSILPPLTFLVSFLAAGGSDQARLWRFGGTPVALITLVLGLHLWENYQADAGFLKRGVPVQAHVARLFAGPCSKRSCSTTAEYDFTPMGARVSYVGYANLGYNSAELAYAKSTTSLPVIYDRDRPKFSEIYFPNKFDNMHRIKVISLTMISFGSILLLALLPVIFIAWRKPHAPGDLSPA